MENAVPNVLIILDCDYAASAARDLVDSSTTKEILAACSRESDRLALGQRSYTRALTDELRSMSRCRSPSKSFTTAMLHSRLMGIRFRLPSTPAYALLSEMGGPSIVLNPRLNPSPKSRSRGLASPSLSRAISPTSSDEASQNQPSLQPASINATETLFKGSFAYRAPLESKLNVEEWKQWLITGTPSGIHGIHVQAANSRHSRSAPSHPDSASQSVELTERFITGDSTLPPSCAQLKSDSSVCT